MADHPAGGTSPEALLRQRYMASLNRKYREMEAAWRDTQVHHWNATALTRLRTRVHRIAGSAGSYGLDELGELARAADTALKLAAADSGKRQAAGMAVQSLLRSLHSLAERSSA